MITVTLYPVIVKLKAIWSIKIVAYVEASHKKKTQEINPLVFTPAYTRTPVTRI